MSKKALPSLAKVKHALYADWALRVKQRAGWKCLLCGATEKLMAHHWHTCDHYAHAARYCVDNWSTLCYACHIRGVHQRADYASVMAVADAVGVTQEKMANIRALSKIELDTATLRRLWSEMRARPITSDGLSLVVRGEKLFWHDKGQMIAVPSNTVQIEDGQFCRGLYEIATVAKTGDGYCYTLRHLEEGRE